jgi:hypothetical protein
MKIFGILERPDISGKKKSEIKRCFGPKPVKLGSIYPRHEIFNFNENLN